MNKWIVFHMQDKGECRLLQRFLRCTFHHRCSILAGGGERGGRRCPTHSSPSGKPARPWRDLFNLKCWNQMASGINLGDPDHVHICLVSWRTLAKQKRKGFWTLKNQLITIKRNAALICEFTTCKNLENFMLSERIKTQKTCLIPFLWNVQDR